MNFLDSYFKTGDKMRSKAARQEFYCAIIEYFYKGENPTFKTEVAEIGWQGVLYSLDKARAGRLGGQANCQANTQANAKAKAEANAKEEPSKRRTKEEEDKPNGFNPPNPPLPSLAEQEADAEFAMAALDAFNAETGQDVRCPSEKLLISLSRIRRSGRTVDDCRAVARKMHALWGREPKMASAVRPSVLFGGKFEEYLALEGPAGDWGGATWE